MKNVTDIRTLHATRKATSSGLTDEQHEILLYAQYSVKMALIELSEINIPELITLGEHAETLSCELEKARASLHGSKQLIQSMLSGEQEVQS